MMTVCVPKWKLLLLACATSCCWRYPLATAAGLETSSSSSSSSPPNLSEDNDELQRDDNNNRFVNLLSEENGVKILLNEDSFQQALEEGAFSSLSLVEHHLHQQQPQLMLALIYSRSCPHSLELLANMEAAIPLVNSYFDDDPIRQNVLRHRPRPLFGKFDGSKADNNELPFLERMRVVAFPTLLFVSNFEVEHKDAGHQAEDESKRRRGQHHLAMASKILYLDYLGLHSTPHDIADTVLQFYYRLVITPRHFHKDVVHVLPLPFAMLQQAQVFVQQHGRGFLRQASSLNLSPELSLQERDYITWLLGQEGKDNDTNDNDDSDQDPLVVFVQCRDHDASIVDNNNAAMLSMFDELSSILSSRPDRAFFSVEDCPFDRLQARDVTAYRIPGTATKMAANNDNRESTILMEWNQFPHVSFMDAFSLSPQPPTAYDLRNFVVQQATPSVLWFDRQSTAPIVFHKSRKVHAVLFVDFFHQHNLLDFYTGNSSNNKNNHSNEDRQNINSNLDLRQQQVVRQFRKTCRLHQDQYQTQEDDMACLIVPSTETRILTTFGIDIWSHWDAMITQNPQRHSATAIDESSAKLGSPVLPDSLPVLLITDQRITGTMLRYYLEPPDIFSQSNAIADFVQSFWMGRLKPELSSSQTKSTSNSSKAKESQHGKIHSVALTGHTFESDFLQLGRHQHRLLLFYARTCGHCKRFFLVWNQLAELIRYIEWDSFLTLYKMDVTENDIYQPPEWNMSVHWLPDLYYFPPSTKETEHDENINQPASPVRYDREDARGDGLGRLNHPLEVVEWLLDVGNFDESALLKLLDHQDEESVEKSEPKNSEVANNQEASEQREVTKIQQAMHDEVHE